MLFTWGSSALTGFTTDPISNSLSKWKNVFFFNTPIEFKAASVFLRTFLILCAYMPTKIPFLKLQSCIKIYHENKLLASTSFEFWATKKELFGLFGTLLYCGYKHQSSLLINYSEIFCFRKKLYRYPSSSSSSRPIYIPLLGIDLLSSWESLCRSHHWIAS